ncbi:MAG: CsgG/HfaB family protein [Verrucomicrobiota bacterium]
MKNLFFNPQTAIALVGFLGLSFSLLANPVSVAVLDFETDNEVNAEYGRDLATLLAVDLSFDDQLAVVERADLAKILSEQEIGLSGAVDPATAAQIGNLTGAQVIIMGRILDVSDTTYLVAKAFSTETSRVFGSKSKMQRGDNPDEIVATLAKDLTSVITDNRESLVVDSTGSDELISELRALTEGRTLPSVNVYIPEEHIGRRIPDPAAQTELIRLLKASGFTVLSDQSKNEADVLITGEAFSEFGMRFRNLLSCTARVEIQVTDPKTGEIILADARNGVALDIAENVAGKTALQNGATLLTPEVVKALVNYSSKK